MTEIIPAVLPGSWSELEEGLAHLRGVAPLVQVDVTESDLFAGQDAMPLWEEFDFEFDLMVPAPDIEVCVALGASRIVLHARYSAALGEVQTLQNKRSGEFPIAVGVALQTHDAVEVLLPFAGLYDYVQVMGIDHEGVQGEPPDPHGADVALVKALRAQYPDLTIQVDGAVAPRVRQLVQAGANRLVVGSAIMHAPDPRATLKALYTEATA